MKIFSSLFLCLLIGVSFSSCQKDSAPPALTNTDHLTASTWVHESSGVDADRNGSIDLSLAAVGVPACRLDNTMTFKKDNSATTNEGAAKCDAADPQTSDFNWSFADNETSLAISNNIFTALNGKLRIRTLNATNLSVSKDTVVASQNVTIIVNMRH